MTGQSFVQIAADSTGKKLDTWIVLGSGGVEVHREAFILSFPNVELGPVTATSVGGETSLHVRVPYLTSVGGIDGIFSQTGTPFPSRVLVVAQGSGGNSVHPWKVDVLTTQSAGLANIVSPLVGGRVDTNVGAWLGSTAPTVGQKTMGSSVPVVIASDQSAFSVSNVTSVGTHNVVPQSSLGRALEFALIDVGGQNDNTLVAADASNRIKVVSFALTLEKTAQVTWKSGVGGAGTRLSGPMRFAGSGGISFSGTYPSVAFQTGVNAALVVSVGSAVSAGGHVAFYREP